MAFRKRLVEGYVVDPLGVEVKLATLSFKLDKSQGYTDTHVIIDRVVTAQTDNTGKFSVLLWVDEDSLVAVNYTVTLPIIDNGSPDTSHTQKISLAWEDGSTKNYGTLVVQSTETSLIPVENLNNAIDERFDIRIASRFSTPPVKIVDPAYVPFAGSLNADVIFSVGSNDNVQNNIGVVNTSNHFVGSSFDLKINASGADKWYVGAFTNLRVTGTSYTGSGQMIGHWITLNNRTNLLATPYMYGVDVSVSVEGHATEAVGGRFAVFKGSAVNCVKFVGVRATAQNGYTNADEVTGGDMIARSGSAGATVTLARSVWAHIITNSGHVFTTARGVDVSGWSNAGTIQNSVGVYIDNSIDVGTVSKRAIKSDSTSLSEFLGAIDALNVAQDGQGLSILGLPMIAKWGTRVIQHGALAVGNNDIYTVPAGYQFLSRHFIEYGNMAGFTIQAGVKVGATYYRLGQISAIGANASRSDAYFFAYESGETVYVNSTGVGKYLLDGYLIPNTSALNIVRPMVTAQTANTNTLLYTVPAGKKAILISAFNPVSFIGSGGWMGATNDSGGNATILYYLVPNGQAVGASFLMQQNVALNTGGIAQFTLMPPVLSAGDSIYYQTSIATAGQVFYGTIIEF